MYAVVISSEQHDHSETANAPSSPWTIKSQVETKNPTAPGDELPVENSRVCNNLSP